MPIKVRGSAFQVDVTRNGKRVQRQAKTLEEAKLLEAQLRAGLEGTQSPAQAVNATTLGQCLDHCVRTVWREYTYVQRDNVRHLRGDLIGLLGGMDTKVADVTRRHLSEVQTTLQDRGLAPASVNRRMYIISSMLRAAEEGGLIEHRPRLPRALRVRNNRIRFLSDDEIGAHLQWYADRDMPEHALTFRLLLDTGMRCGELLRLTSRDADMDRRVVHIWETKNGKPRSIPMTPEVHRILGLGDRAWKIGYPLFYKYWARAKDELGLAEDSQYTPHVLRHTCASRLVQRGAGLLHVQQWLGHSSIQMTQRYAHLAPDDLTPLADLLGA